MAFMPIPMIPDFDRTVEIDLADVYYFDLIVQWFIVYVLDGKLLGLRGR